jgi:estrogen-related receptor beta like 1
VCHILKSLTDTALNKTRFTWQKPAYPREEDHEEINDEGRQELTLSMVDDHIHEDVDDSDDEEGGAVFLDISNTHTDNSKGVPTLGNALEPSVDPEEWEREVERVLPSLKMKLKQDNNRDWRLHYEQMHQYHDNIKSTLSDTKVTLICLCVSVCVYNVMFIRYN